MGSRALNLDKAITEKTHENQKLRKFIQKLHQMNHELVLKSQPPAQFEYGSRSSSRDLHSSLGSSSTNSLPSLILLDRHPSSNAFQSFGRARSLCKQPSLTLSVEAPSFQPGSQPSVNHPPGYTPGAQSVANQQNSQSGEPDDQ